MIPPGLLITLFTTFFLMSLIIILKTGDRLFAVFYIVLFVYTIFTQIGYVYHPDLAINLSVYYGQDIFYDYWLFTYLSFGVTFVMFLMLKAQKGKLRIKRQVISVKRRDGAKMCAGVILFGVVTMYLMVLFGLFVLNYEDVGYAKIENKALAYLIFLQPLVCVALYGKVRRHAANRAEQYVAGIFLAIAMTVLLSVSVRIGQRMTLVGLFVGLGIFELQDFAISPQGLRSAIWSNRRRLVLVALLATSIVVVASGISYLRGIYLQVPLEAMWDILAEVDVGQMEKWDIRIWQIIAQDYFAPSLLLFASIEYQLVVPLDVVKSNLLNSLVFTGYPTLAEIIGSVANTGVVFSRNEGFAYYLLTEGFNAAGWLGILYNGVVINAGVALWRPFASSNNREFNLLMTALMSTLVIAVVRAPSFLFVKFVYLMILPATVLCSLSIGYLPSWQRYDKRGIPRESAKKMISPRG